MKIGEEITVEVRNTNVSYMARWWPATSVYRGQLVENLPWASKDEICMTSRRANGFIRIIRRDNIVSVVAASGGLAEEPQKNSQAADQEWQVAGSKGASYLVSRRGGRWSCDCLAGAHGRACKHVAGIKDQAEA